MGRDKAKGAANPERIEYDRESDLLDVYFEDERRAWTVELTENVTVSVDRQRERVVALSFLDFSRLARPTTDGALSFPVTGLAELPLPERNLVLRLLTSPPVSRWMGPGAEEPVGMVRQAAPYDRAAAGHSRAVLGSFRNMAVPMTNPYLELTRELNQGRLRALISSGQAVVVHRLAIMSKDGDWVLREDEEATGHVLDVLARCDARYRFGAPLDPRWLAGGWSSHFEYRERGLRLRTDFVTRPPRVSEEELRGMWRDSEASGAQVVPLEPLTELKMTRREKDYAVIGELARSMTDPRAQLLYSRSGRDLIRLAREHPATLAEVLPQRPLLARIPEGRDALDEALDRERRALMRADEDRLARYREAAEAWAVLWPEVAREIAGLPLQEAHRVVASRAEGVLPFEPPAGDGGP